MLVAVEQAGVRIDSAALSAQSRQVEQELGRLMKQIYELAGGEFNINSPKQLAEILFEKLQLPVGKRTGATRTPSTAVEVLEELALVHELPRLILDWRGLMKLKGTYIDALPLLVNPDTGRVHTSFNQAVAATGRLSSSDPNLQNIPIRTELGREIRRAFIADPGHVLISADYSQIELRVLAHLADDDTLIAAFKRGDDIHDQTALKMFGADSGKDAHALRSTAKMINYALLYGKTAFTLAKDIGVTPQAAQEFIDAYFAGFPRVRTFIDKTLEDARVTGVVKTMFGRRRLVPDLTSRDFQRRSAAERAAVNMPIQGTAADIMKRAMVDVHRAIAATPDDPDRSRRAAVRGAAGRGRGVRRDRARTDAVGGGPESPAGRGRRHRARTGRTPKDNWYNACRWLSRGSFRAPSTRSRAATSIPTPSKCSIGCARATTSRTSSAAASATCCWAGGRKISTSARRRTPIRSRNSSGTAGSSAGGFVWRTSSSARRSSKWPPSGGNWRPAKRSSPTACRRPIRQRPTASVSSTTTTRSAHPRKTRSGAISRSTRSSTTSRRFRSSTTSAASTISRPASSDRSAILRLESRKTRSGCCAPSRSPSRLDFTIDPPLAEAIRLHRHEIAKSSPPRLLEEYYKILRAGSSERTFRSLSDVGLLEPISAELHQRVGETSCGNRWRRSTTTGGGLSRRRTR